MNDVTVPEPAPKQKVGIRPGARLAIAVAAGLALSAACTSSQISGPSVAADVAPEAWEPPRLGSTLEPGASFIGNFLAGSFARTQNDGDHAIEYFSAALAKDPENLDLNFQAGVLLVSEGRIAEAIPLLSKLSGSGKGTTVVDLVLAVEDIARGNFKEAADRLSQLKKNGINNLIGPLLRGWALADGGDIDGALDALKGLQGESTDAGALQNLHAALINDVAGRSEAALASFNAATTGKAAGGYRAIELYGEFLERAGKPVEAKEVYENFLAEHPGSTLFDASIARLGGGAPPPHGIANAREGAAQALFDLAGAFRQQNAREMGLLFGRLALYLKADFPAVRILLGDILEANQRLESANTVYSGIDRASPLAWSSRIRVGLNLDDLDRPDDAVAHLRELAAEKPSEAQPLITIGNILRGRDRFAEAVVVYDEAFTRIPKLEKHQWSLLYFRGMALERSAHWERAEADFLAALDFEPEQPYVLNYLGYSWVDKGLHLDRAMDMIERAVKLRPNDGFIVDSLGWANYRLGKFGEAVHELERAIELRPEDPIINDHLGDAYWKVGRHKEAEFQWRRSLTLDPEDDLVPKIERKIERGLTKEDEPGNDG
ncbi:MAG: tetratricopeptide repeat protein [Alphaproteobacteria bacterium]|nr:tetratricopeptide repeat protein [Alphaproteobacteria bacterium]